MKFYKVIRFWVKSKYNLTSCDLDVLFFLYSEGLFSVTDFDKFIQIFPWDRNRFNRLKKDGWIVKWRNACKGEKALYEISYKGRVVVGNVYKKLLGEEISEEIPNNPMFYKTDATFTTKVHRNALIQMNKEYKERKTRPTFGK